MLNLRPYQQQAKASIKEQFTNGTPRVIFCCPTGSGKTVTFSDIARSAIKIGNKVLIVVDRKELLDQAKAKLIDYGLNPSLITAGRYPNLNRNCYVATVQTLMRRKMPPADIVIIDEAHKQSFDKILDKEEYANSFFIGATATPIRTGRMRSLHTLYGSMVESATIKQLVSEGFLVPAITYGSDIDVSQIKTKGHDFDPTSMLGFYEKSVLYGDVVKKYQDLTPGTKALVFNINVEHSKKTCQAFQARGIRADHLDGTMSKSERDRVITQFRMGFTQVLCNCEILTTGFDEWSIETIVVNRSTKSLPLWLQMCGRGSRPDPDLGDKKTHFNLIDMGGNVFRHGFWEQTRSYELEHKHKKAGDGVPPMKECPTCKALVYASVVQCEYCGHKFNMAAKIIEADFTLMEYENPLPEHLRKPWAQMSIKELDEVRQVKGYKQGWVIRQIMNRSDLSIENYAEYKGYKPGWVYKQKQLFNKIA